MKRLGIFGGTFNPVHSGHVKLAQGYLWELSLDRLLVIPTHTPPHKPGAELISGEHRKRMCELAFAGVENCAVSDLEIRRGRKSYTVDTLETLRESYDGAEFYLIMGSDMFLTITEWRDWPRIFHMATLCVAAREHEQREQLKAHARALAALGARCRVTDAQPFVVSSTELRRRLAAGEPAGDALPDAVANYIRAHGLYSGG